MKLEEKVTKITIRGYDENHHLEADLSKYKIGVHLLADYCPTDRYIFIAQKMSNVNLKRTWKGIQGKIVEETYFEVFESARSYVVGANVQHLEFADWVKSTTRQIIKNKRHEITLEKKRLSRKRKPRKDEVKDFLRTLKILVEYELQLFSSYMQFLISKKFNINLRTEFQSIFDYVFKHPVDGTQIGLAANVTPDFVYLRKVAGDIKTGEWEEFFRVIIAAYAMAWEASEQVDMNYGIVVNPTFQTTRTVPLYQNSDIFVIDNALRKAFLAKRNAKLKILKQENIPQKPPDDSECKDCGYWDFCWR